MAAGNSYNGHLFPGGVALFVALALSGIASRPAQALAEASAAARDCASCTENREKLGKNRAAQAHHKDVLAKNMDYLARLGPEDTSKAIKVKSNIVIIQLRLETMQNEISHAGDWIATHGCDRCQ